MQAFAVSKQLCDSIKQEQSIVMLFLRKVGLARPDFVWTSGCSLWLLSIPQHVADQGLKHQLPCTSPLGECWKLSAAVQRRPQRALSVPQHKPVAVAGGTHWAACACFPAMLRPYVCAYHTSSADRRWVQCRPALLQPELEQLHGSP